MRLAIHLPRIHLLRYLLMLAVFTAVVLYAATAH
jgi:hypothetical protein